MGLYMNFDDFCNVFRYLYVCKHYDPARWSTISRPGIWKKAQNEEDKKNQEQEDEQDPETKKRMKALAQVDTAGGLPSVDNPGVVLENNPHYSLKIHRPTEVRIVVSQNRHPKIPMRLETLGKEDIVEMSDGVTADRVRYLTTYLQPGLYIFIVATYVHKLEGSFTVNVTSNYRIALDSVWPPRWVMGQERNTNDLVNELASNSVNQAVVKFRKITKKLFGSGQKVKKKTGIIGVDDESESEPEDSD